MLAWLFFFFIALGAKIILAVAMIYLILEQERGCPACDGETALVRMGPAGRLLGTLSGGRVQKRWCPRCGWEGLTRGGRAGAAGGVPRTPSQDARRASR